jgi:hypothetical protein
MRRRGRILLVVLVALGSALAWRLGGDPAPERGPDAGPDSPYRLHELTGDLRFPVGMAVAADQPQRLYVIEKEGAVRIVEDGRLLPQPAIDLAAKVSDGGEQGLLGIAFDPQVAGSRRVYLSYTDGEGDSVIARYRLDEGGLRIDPDSEQVLLRVEQPYANHNGGQIAFGPDGMLYVALGDGGSGGDPHDYGQRRDELLGALLRLDVRGDAGYAIPPDNPWAGVEGARGELWNIGLRNPWRFAFDRANGDLYLGDVGQDRSEEIDYASAADGGGRGLNFGWNRLEGADCFPPGPDCDRRGLTSPVHTYPHSERRCSVTGGHVYRGEALPELRGHYFYADFCTGGIASLRVVGGRATELRDWPGLASGDQVTSFGEDAAGELYLLTAQGGLYRLERRD